MQGKYLQTGLPRLFVVFCANFRDKRDFKPLAVELQIAHLQYATPVETGIEPNTGGLSSVRIRLLLVWFRFDGESLFGR